MEEIKKADSLDSKFTVFKLSLKKIRQMGLWDRIFPDLSELWFRTISAQLCDDLFFECIDDLRIEEFVECGANDAYASKHLSIKGVSSIAIEPNPINRVNIDIHLLSQKKLALFDDIFGGTVLSHVCLPR